MWWGPTAFVPHTSSLACGSWRQMRVARSLRRRGAEAGLSWMMQLALAQLCVAVAQYTPAWHQDT